MGLNVAKVNFEQTLDRDVLLVTRFDRELSANHQTRLFMLSALSLMGLDEMEARYASYSLLADIIRKSFRDPKQNLKELFSRLIFNILIGNTDDHARNHAAFWNGKDLTLTPAYDLCPQLRAGQEATQAMAINGSEGNFSTVVNALSIADKFLLKDAEARDIAIHQIETVQAMWPSLCKELDLGQLEQKRFLGNVILSEYALGGLK